MADHFEIQSNRLVAEQIEIRIRRAVEGVILGPNAVYPKVVHLLPSLILALKNLEERKTDFQKNSQAVWTQLLRLFQNIQELDTESELIDLSAATKLAEITTELSKSQLELTQPELREASGPVRGIKLLTEVLINCGRKTLTFLLGEILCLHELLPSVPKREEHFLNYFPSQEIQRVDEDGDYHTVVQEIGEASYFVLESFINSHANFSEKYSSPLHVSELSLQIGTSTITQSGAIGNTQAGADQSIEQIKSASPSQEVLTQNIYPGVRIIDQENEEEFEEIIFISSFSFRGTNPESEQTEPSGQSKQVRESISPEPEKTIAREQNSSLRRTSPGGQTELSEQSQRFGLLRSTQSEKTITKEQTLDGIFADFGESRNSTDTNKGTEPIESIDYRDRNQKQHRKIPSTPQTSPKRSARIEDFCLLSNTNLITKMNTDTTPKFAAASDLSAFQKDQYVRSSLQSLPSFSGGALQRFDNWLETFEAIMYDSDMTEKDTILELYKKMTDKAHRTMKYILHSGNDKFEEIKEKLLDHFHGDETTEKSLKKFKKANRKPGEKIYDFAIRLKELFRYAYPKNYEEDSFQIILKEKFIDGIDEKLQMKVKYKEFRTFDELVAATRKYSVRMEAIESNKERHEFVNAINQTSHSNNSEIQEIKQIVRLVGQKGQDH